MISLPTLSDVIRQLHEIYKIFRPIFPKKFTPLFFARKIAETIPRVLGRLIRPAISWITIPVFMLNNFHLGQKSYFLLTHTPVFLEK